MKRRRDPEDWIWAAVWLAGVLAVVWALTRGPG